MSTYFVYSKFKFHNPSICIALVIVMAVINMLILLIRYSISIWDVYYNHDY